MRIFLIDDDHDYRTLVAMFLEMRGYEVITAADPTGCPVYCSANETCPHVDPCGDILLIDQNMPNLTGLEFIRRQLARGCKGSVRNKAVLSGNLTDAEQAQALELGCALFQKPFHLHALLEWIEGIARQLPRDRRLVNLG